jgi:hypothetical protein
MAGKQDSPERGKSGDYGRILPYRGVFSHLFFQACREGDGRSRSVRDFNGVLALREGGEGRDAFVVSADFRLGREASSFLAGTFCPSWMGIFLLLCGRLNL